MTNSAALAWIIILCLARLIYQVKYAVFESARVPKQGDGRSVRHPMASILPTLGLHKHSNASPSNALTYYEFFPAEEYLLALAGILAINGHSYEKCPLLQQLPSKVQLQSREMG
jgi:hypothetical protein